jgi:flagellar basal body P-ring formation protein FlgA
MRGFTSNFWWIAFRTTVACGMALATARSGYGAVETEGAGQPLTNQLPVFQLRAATNIDGAGVFLDQVAIFDNELPHLRLCDAPAFGKPLVLKRSQIIDLARSAGFDQPLTNAVGPEAIRVSRRSRTLDEKEAIQLLTAVLQKEFVKDQGELELRLARPWATAIVPDEDFTFNIVEIPTSGVAQMFIVRFEVQTAYGEHIGSWQAPLQAKIWRDVWVAASFQKRGACLHGADLTRERRDMLVCREPLADLSSDQSLEFSESLQPGAPILARVVRPRTVVHRGQSIAAMVQDGALMITLKVEALEDGAAGQVIRVRNPISRRDLRGKVLDEQNVLVSL